MTLWIWGLFLRRKLCVFLGEALRFHRNGVTLRKGIINTNVHTHTHTHTHTHQLTTRWPKQYEGLLEDEIINSTNCEVSHTNTRPHTSIWWIFFKRNLCFRSVCVCVCVLLSLPAAWMECICLYVCVCVCVCA